MRETPTKIRMITGGAPMTEETTICEIGCLDVKKQIGGLLEISFLIHHPMFSVFSDLQMYG